MSNLSQPKVSVVTVVYNRVSQIEQTILSVVSQKYFNIEYIIIDGGSTDGTVDVIRRYETGISFWASEPDKGIYDGMNKAIARASGEWINFMNCGDRFYSDESLSFFEKPPDGDVIYGDAMIEYPGFTTMWKKTSIEKFWQGPSFCHQACFVRTALMKEKGFDTGLRLSSDFDFLFKLWHEGKQFTYVEKIICWYDLKEGASVLNRMLSLKERRKAVLRMEPAVGKRVYLSGIIAYENITSRVKKIIGKHVTGWVTRILRK